MPDAAAPADERSLEQRAEPYFDVNARGYDVERYHFSSTITDLAKVSPLGAQVRITLTVTEDELSAIVLDSQVEVQSVEHEGKALPFVVPADSTLLLVDVASLTLTRGRTVELLVDYDIQTESFAGLVVGVGDSGECAGRTSLFTRSEARKGMLWLPGHHIAWDRAFFDVDLRIPSDLDAIANGERSVDEADGKLRHVAYRSAFTMPTYTMAFAVDAFETKDRLDEGKAPLSVWAPTCLSDFDFDTWLFGTRRMMRMLEERLGPYPFGRYSTVFVNGYGYGGMENTGVTFLGVESLTYAAHELAHQWLGDYLTVHGHADTWIKEGMAVLLSTELAVHYQSGAWEPLDYAGSYRAAVGGWQPVYDGSFYDENYDDLQWLHVGSYDVSAHWFSQLRVVVGEETFWETWRALLEERAFGDVTSEQLLTAFEPHIPEAVRERARKALLAEQGPGVNVRQGEGGFVFELEDLREFVFAPVLVTSVAADGTATNYPLIPGEEVNVPVEEGGYIVIDEQDLFPELLFQYDAYCALLAPHLVPTDPRALARFEASGPAALRTCHDTLPVMEADAGAGDGGVDAGL